MGIANITAVFADISIRINAGVFWRLGWVAIDGGQYGADVAQWIHNGADILSTEKVVKAR